MTIVSQLDESIAADTPFSSAILSPVITKRSFPSSPRGSERISEHTRTASESDGGATGEEEEDDEDDVLVIPSRSSARAIIRSPSVPIVLNSRPGGSPLGNSPASSLSRGKKSRPPLPQMDAAPRSPVDRSPVNMPLRNTPDLSPPSQRSPPPFHSAPDAPVRSKPLPPPVPSPRGANNVRQAPSKSLDGVQYRRQVAKEAMGQSAQRIRSDFGQRDEESGK